MNQIKGMAIGAAAAKLAGKNAADGALVGWFAGTVASVIADTKREKMEEARREATKVIQAEAARLNRMETRKVEVIEEVVSSVNTTPSLSQSRKSFVKAQKAANVKTEVNDSLAEVVAVALDKAQKAANVKTEVKESLAKVVAVSVAKVIGYSSLIIGAVIMVTVYL